MREIFQEDKKMKKSEIIDLLWERGDFEDYRQVKDISKEMWKDFKVEAGNLTMTLKSKPYLKKLVKGWRQIKPPARKSLAKTDEMEEIEQVLGSGFKIEVEELKIAFLHQPNSAAFLMRKIFEKLLFIIISKSNEKSKITDYKRQNNGELPQLSNLLNWAQTAEVNNIHIATPRNLRNIAGSKFFGDNAAHNYLISVSFEDLKPEIPQWRILIKELAKNL